MAWDDFSDGGKELQDNKQIIDVLTKHDTGKKFMK